MNSDHHTSKQYDAELEAVRSRVLQMGGLVEQQIMRSHRCALLGDMPLIDQIIADDHQVNALEVEIDEMCNHVIARRQPAAGDLRLIMAVVKTITDLERIGDEAEKIARMAKLICEVRPAAHAALHRDPAHGRPRARHAAQGARRLRPPRSA